MSLPKFLYFITEKDGRTRQIVNGVVTSLNNPKPLPQAPDGNQEISIGWERSQLYRGNIRNFGLELGFVGAGGTILRNDRYKFNLDRELYLLIKRLTYTYSDTLFKEFYKQLYKGQFDFSTSNDDQGGYRFNIGLMEGGLQRLLKANESTTYELPFDLDAKNIYMDGMYISGAFKWLLTEDTFQNEKYVSLFVLNNDNPVPGLAVFDVQKNSAGSPITADTLDYFAQTTQDIAGVRLTGTLVNVEYSFADLNVQLEIYNTISDTVRLTIDLAPADPYAQNSNIVIDETFDLLKGDRLFFKVGSAPLSITEIKESTIILTLKSKALPSYIKGFTLYDVGRKLTEKITGNADDFDSTLLADLLTNFGSEIILTSGDGVRGITDAALKTSWKDFYKFVDVVLMSQMTITDKIRIYDRITAYQPISVKPAIALGEIKNLKVTPAIDEMFTSIKVGHQDQQVDDTNGKFDFNGNMIFTTPVKSIPDKQLDLQSPYKAGPFEIEQTRANYEGKLTTDKSTDNDVFAIAVQRTATDSFDTIATFQADGAPLTPGEPLLTISAGLPEVRPGMKIRITGSVSNDAEYTIKSATGLFFGQIIVTNEALIDEGSVNISIEILEGQLYNLDRGIPITQLSDPDADTEVKDSVYNVRLSPKRILLRHSAWIAGALYGYTGELVFSSANRNKELIAGGVIEKANVSILSLGDPMFIPQYFEFDLVSPINMPEDLENDPNPNYGFPWKGSDYNGFFIRGGIALNDLEEQTFKLLATPDNNLLSLIY